jgi:hypothetical protein
MKQSDEAQRKNQRELRLVLRREGARFFGLGVEMGMSPVDLDQDAFAEMIDAVDVGWC